MEELANMSPEQRRELYTGALDNLGVVIETLRYTGWNPFADDAPSESSFGVDATGAQRMGSFVDDETGFAIVGAYHYQKSRNATGIIPGDYRYMQIEVGDSNRAIDLCDIRKEDGGRVQYIAFDSQTAAFISGDEVNTHGINGVLETYHTIGKTNNIHRQVVIGTEMRHDGTNDIFIRFEHERHETESMLERAYRIHFQDYVDGKYDGNELFGLEGTREMIDRIATLVPEMFTQVAIDQDEITLNISGGQVTTEVVGKGRGYQVVETTIVVPSPEANVEVSGEIEDETLTFIRYCLACKRYEAVASQLVYLADNNLVINKTGFVAEELYEKIRTGWVALFEHEEEITLVPFDLKGSDKVVLFNSGIGIETDDEIVANISRARLWVQRGRYEDLRMDTPAEIDPEEVYDLLKRGYIDPVYVMDRIVKSVWPVPGMNSEMTLSKIAECVRFGLKSGTLKAELVEGICGPEYRLTTTQWEADEDVEVLTRHFNRLELMHNLARQQDYDGSLRALLEAGEISDESGFPFSGIEAYVAMGELTYFPGEDTVRYTRIVKGGLLDEYANKLDLSGPEEAFNMLVRRRIGDSSQQLDQREKITAELDRANMEALLSKGYINIRDIEDRFINDADLFDYGSPIEFRAAVARIILEGLDSGDFDVELNEEGDYGPEYVIYRVKQEGTDDVEYHEWSHARTGGRVRSIERDYRLPEPNDGNAAAQPLFPGRIQPSVLAGRISQVGRMPVLNESHVIPDLPQVTALQLEERFGVNTADLDTRIRDVVDRATKHELIRAGMWDVKGPEAQKRNLSDRRALVVDTYQQGSLIVNTALVFQTEGTEGIVGVLTDVDTAKPDTIKTMVVDYRKVVGTEGKTRLVVTCLQKDVSRGNIILPSVKDGGYVFELEFEDEERSNDPEIIKEALQALKLNGNFGEGKFKVNRYILSGTNAGDSTGSIRD